MKLFNVKILVLILASMFSLSSLAGIAVVVHPSVDGTDVSSDAIAKIFLDKAKALPNGTKMVPLDQDKGEASRDKFYADVVKKDEYQLNAYWSRVIFTGKGRPPKVISGGDEQVKELVSANPNIIGYIDSGSVDSSVKVLLQID